MVSVKPRTTSGQAGFHCNNSPVDLRRKTRNEYRWRLGFHEGLGLDGFHAVSMAGVAPVQTWLPITTAGAVKKGEVAVVLKARWCVPQNQSTVRKENEPWQGYIL